MIPILQIEYKNKKYKEIKKMLVDMSKDKLEIFEIFELLTKMGFDKTDAEEIIESHIDIIL
jgi:hypothetical protein